MTEICYICDLCGVDECDIHSLVKEKQVVKEKKPGKQQRDHLTGAAALLDVIRRLEEVEQTVSAPKKKRCKTITVVSAKVRAIIVDGIDRMTKERGKFIFDDSHTKLEHCIVDDKNASASMLKEVLRRGGRKPDVRFDVAVGFTVFHACKNEGTTVERISTVVGEKTEWLYLRLRCFLMVNEFPLFIFAQNVTWFKNMTRVMQDMIRHDVDLYAQCNVCHPPQGITFEWIVGRHLN